MTSFYSRSFIDDEKPTILLRCFIAATLLALQCFHSTESQIPIDFSFHKSVISVDRAYYVFDELNPLFSKLFLNVSIYHSGGNESCYISLSKCRGRNLLQVCLIMPKPFPPKCECPRHSYFQFLGQHIQHITSLRYAVNGHKEVALKFTNIHNMRTNFKNIS